MVIEQGGGGKGQEHHEIFNLEEYTIHGRYGVTPGSEYWVIIPTNYFSIVRTINDVT